VGRSRPPRGELHGAKDGDGNDDADGARDKRAGSEESVDREYGDKTSGQAKHEPSSDLHRHLLNEGPYRARIQYSHVTQQSILGAGANTPSPDLDPQERSSHLFLAKSSITRAYCH
jgi:hypothetical protein